MCELSIWDIADIASIFVRYCCYCRCRGCHTSTNTNWELLAKIYCVRIYVGIILTSIEFGSENGSFIREYNQTIPEAFHDGLINANTYNSFIVVILTICILLVVSVCHLCLLNSNFNSTENRYWVMVFVYKVISFVMDFNVMIFTVFLGLSIGDKVIDLSTTGLKSLITVIFFIKILDMILDLLFMFKTLFKNIYSVC